MGDVTFLAPAIDGRRAGRQIRPGERVVLPDWRTDQVAMEYDARGRPHGRPFDHPWAEDGPYWNLRGNGGLLSTVRDMFPWHVALEGDKLLDQRAKNKLFKPHVREQPGGDSYYGCGWVVSEPDGVGRVVGHNGRQRLVVRRAHTVPRA